MASEQPTDIDRIVTAVATMSPNERRAYLDRVCENDPDLRSSVETRLRREDKPILTRGERPETEVSAPDRIGGYRILGVLGGGGMGLVYRAEQERPRRVVALKVIRSGVPSAELLRRFEHEVEVLGRLRHPGIAQIFEAGLLDTGAGRLPYFVMELIEGRVLTQYANDTRLGAEDRLELMCKLGDAVHYAHQRGVIHRDLKPGNILVEESGQPRILDFGLARVTDGDVQAVSMQTQVGQLVGTIPYMSPEQVRGDPHELDTRSDVYALGVICYELLTGQLPYALESKSLPEAVRTISEADPPPLRSVNAALCRDLETIVAKALEKDRERRYQSASEFCEDIRRYLRDEPVAARPPSTTYQLRKFARRHRALVGGLTAAFVILVAGIITTTWQAVRAKRAEVRAIELAGAEKAQRELAEQRQAEAERQTAIAREVNEFLNKDLLAAADPLQEGDRNITMQAVLDRAAQRIEGRFVDAPLVEASIRATLGNTYYGLGMLDSAEPHLKRAVELYVAVRGEVHRETVIALTDLAMLYNVQGRYDEAEGLGRRALGISRQLAGDEDADTLSVMSNLAVFCENQGNFAEAEALLARALEISRRLLGPDDDGTLARVNNLACLYEEMGRHDQAEPLLRELVDGCRRKLGAEHPQTLTALNNLAYFYREQEDFGESERLLVEVLEISRRVLGEEHPETLRVVNNLARLYVLQGRYQEAQRELVWALEVSRRTLGAEHPDTLSPMVHLARLYRDQRQFAEAVALSREAVDIARRAMPAGHYITGFTLEAYGSSLIGVGRYEEAEAALQEAYEILAATIGPNHSLTVPVIEAFVALYEAWGKPAQANDWRARLSESEPSTQATLPEED